MTAPSADRAIGSSSLTDALVLIGIAAALTLLFALTPLDIAAARLFYSAQALNHWPLAARLPWRLLYQASTWITTSLVLVGLGVMATALLRRRALWRRYAIFILLSVVIGPGLLINGVFKDHWDRPRPRDIVEFGGPQRYTVAPLRGQAGASFPCGHCSVGFLYALGWWIWRRRRPRLAMASAALGAAAGLALGLGRMAAGGHFLSDVLWSALIALGIAHLLFHHVLRIPAWEEAEALATAPRPASRARQIALATLTALGGVIVLLALFAAPHGAGIAERISLASLPQRPQLFEVQASTADVDITLVDSPAVVAISGELHGFGLPTSQLSAHSAFSAEPVPTLSFRIVQRGWFTDLDSTVAIQLPASDLKRLIVRLDRGNIRISDATATGVTRIGRLVLELRTRAGLVQRP